MARTAEVVVIGGGINGTSIAWQLARRGVKNVVLVEKGHIASGPTGRSSGIVRQHYSIETLAAMARDSVRVFQNFEEEVGGDAGFVQAGVMFFCSQQDAPTLEQTVAMHRRIGIREQLLPVEELRKLEPALSMDGIAWGAYEPDGGYADPALAANSFAEAAKRLGVELMKRTRVTGLKLDGARIAGVVTDAGEISSRTVINVAGPWGAEIAAMAGADIPIYATRHAVIILQRPPRWRNATPVWVDLIEGRYHKPERGAGIMVGSIHNMGPDQRVEIETYATTPAYHEVEEYSGAAMKRFPVMAEGVAQGGWAGLYDMTPDSQPVIDRVPEVEGFYCAVGFSGHGFKLSPAIGVAMAELVIDGCCRPYDLAPFRYDRFRLGQLTRGAYAHNIVG